MADQHDPNDYVRVKVKDTGHRLSLRWSVVDADPDTYQILKQDAVDNVGRPLPVEHAGSDSAATTTSGKES